MREIELDNWFYIGSLNHRATSSLQGQPEPGFHYYQKFYKSHTKITLLNNKQHQDFLLKQKSKLQPCKNHTYRSGITQGAQPEAQELQNLMVTLPSQPYTSSSSFYQDKMPPRSIKIFNLLLVAVWFRGTTSFLVMNDRLLC